MGPVSRSLLRESRVTLGTLGGVSGAMVSDRSNFAACLAQPRARNYRAAMTAWPRAHAGLGDVGAEPSGRPAGMVWPALCPKPVSVGGATSVRDLWASSATHSAAFGLRRSRSLLALAASGRLRRHGAAICSLTRVANRRLVPLLAIALVMLMATPAVALGLAADPDLGAAGRLLWLGSAFVLTIAGIVVVTRHLLLARRWARSASVFELSNFASGSPGNGDAASLLGQVVAEADEQRRHLVLRVDHSNERAIVLYRRHGFVEVEGVSSTGQVSMERTTRDVGTTARNEHRLLLVAAVVVAVLAIAVTEMASPLMVVSLALSLASLGVAAGVDLRSMRIPNSLLVVAALFGAVAADVTNAGLGPLAGAGIAAVPLLLIHLLDPGAIGFGDVKFAAASGVVVAAIAWPVAIMVPLVGFVGVAIVRIVTPRRPQPFGPYLMVATTVAVVAASLISTGANA